MIDNYAAIGWETPGLEKLYTGAEQQQYREYAKGAGCKLNTISKVVGYFPGVSVIVGLARMAFSVVYDGPNSSSHTLRGIGEILQFGTFLFLIDATVYKVQRDIIANNHKIVPQNS